MKPVPTWLEGRHGAKVCIYEWAKRDPKAVIIILHGMAEHALRYERFADALVNAGYAVMSMDMRGHGQTAVRGIHGHFDSDQGDISVLSDVQMLTMRAMDIYRGKGIILFAHSMGTVIAQCAMERFGDLYKGEVLTGVTTDKPGRRAVTPMLTGIMGAFERDRLPSPTLNRLSFASYNKPFEPDGPTAFEWLSRDRAEVDKYVADPKCGFVCTPNLYNSVAKMILYMLSHANKIPKDVRIHLAAGSEDPVGGERAVRELERLYTKQKLNVSTKVYPGARHELLNETNRDEVTADLIAVFDEISQG